MVMRDILLLLPFTERAKARKARKAALAAGLPHMTENETCLLEKYIRSKDTVVEYGSGASTFFLLSCDVKRVVSIETDVRWIARIQRDRRSKDGRLRMLHADIGPVHGAGMPKDEAEKFRWPAYPAMPWPLEGDPVVLIDGRFRVASALTSALFTAGPILVHDYFERPEYAAIGEQLTLVESADELAVFERREASDKHLKSAIEVFLFDPR